MGRTGLKKKTKARTKTAIERKSARMELRLTQSSKRVIERAVALSGLAPSDLAYDAARRVIEEHERFVVRGDDSDAFLEAVASPPPPTARLIAALRRHRDVAPKSAK